MTSICKHCGCEISWTTTWEGKNLPTNPDGSPHRCKEFLQQKSGILLKHDRTGCTVRMANGDKVYALKTPFPEDVVLPQNIDFAIDKQSFIISYQFRGSASAVPQEKPATNFTPANEIKGGTTNPAPPAKETPPAATTTTPEKATDRAQGKQPEETRNCTSPALVVSPGNGKEQWLRYISTLNTATAILDGVWQPDPAKPQAENIADKIEWVVSIAAGLRARYAREQGGGS